MARPFPVLVNAAERKDAESKLLFIRLTVFNATDRRKYERDLLKARDEMTALAEELERKSRQGPLRAIAQSIHALYLPLRGRELREQFVAVLGHDLRNPLAAIAAGIQLIQRVRAGRKK